MTNIAKLLKDAPNGMKLYSPLLGEVEFAEVMDTDYVPIRVIKRGYGLRFDEYGRYMGNEYPDSECLLFPSKDCRTWEGWKLPVKPKYKIGDKVIYNSRKRTITFMDEKYYYFDGGCAGCRIDKQDELLSPAPKPHYDISNFKPYQKVLIRFGNNDTWRADFFSHIKEDRGRYFVGIGYANKQCIPFKGNEHLLGTTDMCPEEYINW